MVFNFHRYWTRLEALLRAAQGTSLNTNPLQILLIQLIYINIITNYI